MPATLKVLFVEDTRADAELCVATLHRAGMTVSYEVVDSRENYIERLRADNWDIVLADYALPGWNGLEALRLLRERDLDTPFILVTGTAGEETAVDCIKQGAADYVLKDRLVRLPFAVERALNEREQERERKQALQALQKSEHEYQRLFQNALVAILIFDPETETIYDANEQACHVYGYPHDELVGMSLRSFTSDVSRGECQLRELLRTGVCVNFETTHRNAAGQPLEMLINSSLIDYRGQRAVLSIHRDMTESRKLEERLRQAEKMEAVGRLAGGIAHDFNNMLTVITGYGELLEDSVAGSEIGSKAVREILKAAERAATLTRQLLAFSRRQILQPRVVGLNGVVSGMVGMLRRLIRENVELRVVLGEGLPAVKADPGQLEQVILNLAVNAQDAMTEGGRLVIETSHVELDEPAALAHGGGAPGHCVLLTVTDTGAGIPKDVMPHIFEPFFSTKEKGKGTGLGLATVYGIVQQSGGHIWVYSEPGQGTVFKVYLPAIAASAIEVPATASPRAAAHAGDETILLVEDEAALRGLLASALAAAGYNVIEAADGREALESLKTRAAPIALVITDVVMREVGGFQLLRRVREMDPEIKFIFMSGYTDDVLLQTELVDSTLPFLQKPFAAGTLVGKVRAVLDAAPGAVGHREEVAAAGANRRSP